MYSGFKSLKNHNRRVIKKIIKYNKPVIKRIYKYT